MQSLYVLRFFASIAVYLHHLYYPFGLGAICVTFFFIISGFTMACSMSNKNFVLTKKSLKKFYFNKLLKLYPLYILTFIASIPIMNFFETKFNISNIIINLLLFQSYFPNKNEVFLFNGLSWFVANIMFFYLVTPFIFHILKKFNIDKNAKILAILILVVYLIAFFISYSFKWKVEAFSIGWWLIYISPFFRIFDYLIGFLAGFIFIRIKKVKNTEREWKFGFSILEISVIGIFLLSYKSKFLLIDSLRYGVYYIPVITFVIIVFAFGKGIISKIISNKILVYLGKLSYIIYMIHQLIIYYMSMFFGNSIFYTQDMVLKNYLSNIFLFFIIICISDVINRYLIPFITRIFTTKILIKKMKIRNY